MKHRIVHPLQKYFLNPPIKVALATGLPLPGYSLLETKGRKTGKARRTPVTMDVSETSSGSWQSMG